MTYRAAIGESMRALGLAPSDPLYRCDAVDCAATYLVRATRRGLPPLWFTRSEHRPPRWDRVDTGSGILHFCPAHREAK